MAQTLHQFDIDDDSPGIAYFPFVNREPSSNVTAGWQLLYTGSGAATGPGQVGVGTSYHHTSLDGASLMVNWTGTGIDLIGSTSNALYNISLDGTPSSIHYPDPTNTVLASFDNLANTNHSLLLTTTITNQTSPNAFLTFDKARIRYGPPAGFVNTTATSQTIADSNIAFLGSWNYVSDSTGNSMHVSNSAGDRAEITFLGSAVTIYGLTSSYSGNFTVTLDNTTTNLSALSSYNNSDTLLFYATDLQDTVHQVAVINQENRSLALHVGGVNITSFGNSTTIPTSPVNRASIPAGTIAAAALAAVLFLIIVGIIYYACCVRRKVRAVNQHTPRGQRQITNGKGGADIERVVDTSPSSREELESTSLSTSKGYGFGLGLGRGFPFAYHKSKLGSNSSGGSRNAIGAPAESHPMTFQFDGDEKRFSMNTLTEDLSHPLESEKLAPGWYNPVARTPPSFRYTRYKETGAILLQTGLLDEDEDDDADIKTLTSRQDEALAATLSLSPRTSEALVAFDGPTLSKPEVKTPDGTKQSQTIQPPEFLHVRDISPFRVDVSAIFGSRKGNRDSRTTSGSSSSTWSKVRTRLYRKAHRDDGRQSYFTDKQESSSSSGPESVPVVMHDSSSAAPLSEAAPGSGTYSFLDFTSSHGSLRRQSKTTPSSTPAEVGHGAKGASSAWSENTSVRMVRVERSRDEMAAKPDAPSTASGGSPSSDNSGAHTTMSAPTPHTQRSSPFPFPITIPPSMHIVPSTPSEHVPERHIPPSPPPSNLDQYLQVPQIAPPELALPSASSPTESVPFSVSDIHFRHSFSDYAGIDSQRASVASALPPHPPLPHRDGSQAGRSTYSPPPPYIVQRVLGLSVSPLSPLSPSTLTSTLTTLGGSTSTLASARRPGTSSSQLAPVRVGSLLGPRPRPSTSGSIRGSAAPQLPMQGGRGNLRGSRS